jgi:hypothetical protein
MIAAGVTAAAIGVHAVAAGIRHFNNKGEE